VSQSLLDPSRVNIRDDAWELVEVSEDYVTHRAVLERYADGTVAYVHRRAPRGVDALLEANRQSLSDSDGQRFGDGKVVGRIPMNILYRDVAPRLKQGDADYLKWFLNNPENRAFRTFRGKI
jgi:hypothetical protein